jgi:hypothetical protein
MHFALHIARRALATVAQQPHELAYRLARLLVGNAVNDDDGDATVAAHRPVRIGVVRSMKPALKSPEKTTAAKESNGKKKSPRMIGAL